jgi:hypothetical protein
MKRLFLTILAMALIPGCTPMIENGRDHRHDPHFRQDDEPARE